MVEHRVRVVEARASKSGATFLESEINKEGRDGWSLVSAIKIDKPKQRHEYVETNLYMLFFIGGMSADF